MTDRPILFSAPMVRALLDGRKTQTRRVLKNMPLAPEHDSLVHPPKHDAPYFDAYCGGKRTAANPRGMSGYWCWWTRDDRAGHGCKVPFIPGDRLWVKETWRTLQKWDDMKPRHVMDDVDKIDYAASGFRRNPLWAWGKTRVSIFMPRWASRITLLVTDVRVERLQDISRDDAIAEGLYHQPGVIEPDWWRLPEPLHQGSWLSPVAAYAFLWREINGPGAWEANPWVVAVTFEVVRGNIDQVASGKD